MSLARLNRMQLGAVVTAVLVVVAAAAIVLLHPRPQKALIPATAISPLGVSASPTSAPPSPTPQPAVECRLPLASGNPDLSSWVRGAFLAYPGGTITVDPASEVASGPGASWYMKRRPALRGDSATPSYDRAARQWLPVRFDAISPDGQRYAWVDYSQSASFASNGQVTQAIHVVDVASGADRVVLATDEFDTPVWDSANTIFLEHHRSGTDAGNGLWRMDAQTGAVTQIDAKGVGWSFIGHGSAWISTVFQGPGDNVLHLDLATGSTATWFKRPGRTVSLIGTDSVGRALVAVEGSSSTDPGELWRVSGPNTATELSLGRGWPAFERAWADGANLWLQSIPDLFRLDASGHLADVANTRGEPTGGCH